MSSKYQMRALLALVLTCFTLLATAGWWQSESVRNYRQDVEYFDRKCSFERQSKEGEYKKDCQRLIFRTFDDPVALLTGALVLATTALFAVTYLLYSAAVRQGADAVKALQFAQTSADAADKSATTAHLALLNDRRAWFSLEIELANLSSTLNEAGLHIQGNITAVNTGNIPALDVVMDHWATTDEQGMYLSNFYTKCEDIRLRQANKMFPSGMQATVFPEKRLNPGVGSYGFTVSRNELEKSCIPGGIQSNINIFLAVCVSYTFATDRKNIHQTRKMTIVLNFTPELLEIEKTDIPFGKLYTIKGQSIGEVAD